MALNTVCCHFKHSHSLNQGGQKAAWLKVRHSQKTTTAPDLNHQPRNDELIHNPTSLLVAKANLWPSQSLSVASVPSN